MIGPEVLERLWANWKLPIRLATARRLAPFSKIAAALERRVSTRHLHSRHARGTKYWTARKLRLHPYALDRHHQSLQSGRTRRAGLDCAGATDCGHSGTNFRYADGRDEPRRRRDSLNSGKFAEMFSRRFAREQFHVRVDHDSHEILESHFRFPAENFFRLG